VAVLAILEGACVLTHAGTRSSFGFASLDVQFQVIACTYYGQAAAVYLCPASFHSIPFTGLLLFHLPYLRNWATSSTSLSYLPSLPHIILP